MDTASHLFIGLGLGAMAHLSTDVAANSTLGLAVTIGTVIASEAPDFDFAYKIKGTAKYLKNHRRWTHSILAWFLWPSLITLGLTLFFDGLPWSLIWLWCFAAVVVHVATDILNTFGAVSLLPFSRKRLSIDVLQVFDPVLFTAQLLGIVLWWTGILSPGPLFAIINAMVIIYIAVRFIFRYNAVRAAVSLTRGQADTKFHIIPTFNISRWKLVLETPTGIRMGSFNFGQYEEEMILPSTKSFHLDMEGLRKDSEVIDTFSTIAECIHTNVKVDEDRIKLTLIDPRFRFGGYFLLKAVVEIDESRRILSQRFCYKGDKEEGITDRTLAEKISTVAH